MRRKSKYGTNKTIRFCQTCRQTPLRNYSCEELSVDKRKRWKLIDFLQGYTQSPDYANKIIVRRNYNFYQYNGYRNELRENPPRHLSFARKPDFIFQPYVNFIKVNQNIFSLVLRNGLEFLGNKNNLEQLFDISSRNISVALIYFLGGLKSCYSSDWSHAQRHARGGYFADYSTVCTGDYCPFGPKLRGQLNKDSKINQVLFITVKNNEEGRCGGSCSCGSWKRPTKFDRHENKRGRSKVKAQRREKNTITNKVRTTGIWY